MSTALSTKVPTRLQTQAFARDLTPELTEVGEAMGRLSKEYVRHIDAGPDRCEIIRKGNPKVSMGVFRNLELMGRGLVHPSLALSFGEHWARALKRLPLSEQTAAIDGGVELMTANGDTLLVNPENMSQDQVKQAFAEDHFRSVPEQRAHIESLAVAAKVQNKAQPNGYVIKGRKLIVGNKSFTRNKLLSILQEMV